MVASHTWRGGGEKAHCLWETEYGQAIERNQQEAGQGKRVGSGQATDTGTLVRPSRPPARPSGPPAPPPALLHHHPLAPRLPRISPFPQALP